MTSTPSRSVQFFLVGVWLLMFVQGLLYVDRYALVNPYVDEWEFVPVLFGEQSAWPWLWDFHNEHRFPLPRLIYWGVFQLTGDLRTGCYVTLVGLALTTLILMRAVQRWRGSSHFTDAVFPLMLLHVGQDENLYMGYQLCFMLTALLSAFLLRCIVSEVSWGRLWRAWLIGVMLLLCGAAGLAMGWCAALWVVLQSCRPGWRWSQRLVLWAGVLLTPLYTVAYFTGYTRPAHHPPSAGLWESVRVALQAQGMAFGPAAQGMWPVFGIVLLLAGVGVLWLMATIARREPGERGRMLGLLLFSGASAGVAFGIGWGRSGFTDDMGFAWRYGLLLAPTIWGSYWVLLLANKPWVEWALRGLLVFVLVCTLVNAISGFRDGERMREQQRAWEADVRMGLTPTALLAKYYPTNPEWAAHLRTFRRHHYQYYGAMGDD